MAKRLLIIVPLLLVVAGGIYYWAVNSPEAEAGPVAELKIEAKLPQKEHLWAVPDGTLAVTLSETGLSAPNESGSLLVRELFRQALLIAGRDELGLCTQDLVFGDADLTNTLKPEDENAPFNVALVVVPGRKGDVRLVHGASGARKFIWKSEFDVKGSGAKLIEEVTALAAKWSKTDFVQPLKERGLKAVSATVRNQMPPGALDDVDSVEFFRQFRALQAGHAGLRESDQPTLRAAHYSLLIRAYSHLGLYTRSLVGAHREAYRARALLYAQRFFDESGGSGEALFLRAYATGFAGYHSVALNDLDAAAKAGRVDDELSQCLKAMLTYNMDALQKVPASSRYAPAARMFAFCIAINCGSMNLEERIAKQLLEKSPTNYYAMDRLAEAHDIDVKHVFTLQGLSTLLNDFPDFLKGTPAYSSAAKSAGDEPSLDGFRDSCRALAALAKKDNAEPGAAHLASLARNLAFQQVVRRVEFMTRGWGVDAREFVDGSAALVEDHPLRDFLQAMANAPYVRQSDIGKFIRGAVLPDIKPQYSALVSLAQAANPALKDKYAQLMEAGFSFSVAELEGRTYGRQHSVVTYAHSLLKLSPHNPRAMKVLMLHDHNAVKDKIAGWIDARKDDPEILCAVAEMCKARDEIDRAAAAYKRYIELYGDVFAYRLLAGVYAKAGETEEWLKTLKASLNAGESGLEPATVRVRIARYYMNHHKYSEALPYATRAAETWAAWAMECGSICNEGLKDWRNAELWARRISERYETQSYQWYFWCRRTGRGNLQSAKRLASDYIGRAQARGYIPLEDLAAFYILEGKLTEAGQQLMNMALPEQQLMAAVTMAEAGMKAEALKQFDDLQKAVEFTAMSRHVLKPVGVICGELKAGFANGAKLDGAKLKSAVAAAYPYMRPYLAWAAARSLQTKGDTALAAEIYRMGCDESPQHHMVVLCSAGLVGLGKEAAPLYASKGDVALTENPEPRLLSAKANEKRVRFWLETMPQSHESEHDFYVNVLSEELTAARQYHQAEQYVMQRVNRDVTTQSFSQLSLVLGKQALYTEAAAAAQQAIQLKSINPWNATMMLAEWQYRSGNKEEGLKTFASTPDPGKEIMFADACRACFYTAVCDEERINEFLKKALVADWTTTIRHFTVNDISLDAYRHKPWFIALVGETVQK